MTRSDLVDALAERFSQLAHRDAEQAVRTMLDAMGEALVKGHRIEIRGFGSFTVNHRPARVGRNPAQVSASTSLRSAYRTLSQVKDCVKRLINRQRKTPHPKTECASAQLLLAPEVTVNESRKASVANKNAVTA